MTDGEQSRRYRFGAFEADAGTGELRRQGIRVRVHDQPFQVLVMLLERPGVVVTREEISAALWPDGTFVDYEHGVNSAINRLREALGDRAKSPRFVETLARRGYRFVAPVEVIGTAVDEAPSRFLATAEDLPKTPQRTVLLLFVGLQLMYLGFYVGALGNLAEIEDLLSVLPWAHAVLDFLIASAAVLIPVRIFLLCAVLFRAPGLRGKYLRLWLFLVPLDVAWALAPFLLLHHMNFGLALACVAPLVYSPFAQRALMLMGADGRR